MLKFIEVDRGRVVGIGGSTYILLPANIRRQSKADIGDEVVFLRSPDSPETVIRIEKKVPPKEGSPS